MKLIVPFALLMAVGCLLTAGCVAVTNKNNESSLSPLADPRDNATVIDTPMLNGSLKVSVSGITDPSNLSVFLDNETVGTVNPGTPLSLMVSEGNHTVMVCGGSVCEQENVTTRFGRYVTVDFSERLFKHVTMLQPTARILEYYKNGDAISVSVEFNNPSTVDHLMSVVVSCGYNYIDDRTGIKMGDSTGGMLVQNVRAGQSITKPLILNFASGRSYSFDNPVIKELKVQ